MVYFRYSSQLSAKIYARKINQTFISAQTPDLSHYFANPAKPALPSDKFRPLHLRYLGYDNLSQDFKILLDKGDTKKADLDNKTYIEENTQTLLRYFSSLKSPVFSQENKAIPILSS